MEQFEYCSLIATLIEPKTNRTLKLKEHSLKNIHEFPSWLFWGRVYLNIFNGNDTVAHNEIINNNFSVYLVAYRRNVKSLISVWINVFMAIYAKNIREIPDGPISIKFALVCGFDKGCISWN